MEVAMEVEDGLFFADLSKQISLLIMDDDDENFDPRTRCPSVSFHSRGDYPLFPTQYPPVLHEQRCRSEQSKGTGVFIPRSLPGGRRKQRHHGRVNSLNTKSSSNSRVVSQQASSYSSGGSCFNYSRKS